MLKPTLHDNRATLKIDDADGQAVVWIATNLKTVLAPRLAALDEKIQFLYAEESFDEDSRREDFTFFSDIYNFCYNRYAERVSIPFLFLGTVC